MTKYKVEWIYDMDVSNAVGSRIIEANDLVHLETIIAGTQFNHIKDSIEVTEVQKYRTMWIEHHSHEGYATDEDDAEHKAIEYAETHSTFDDYGGFDVEEIESIADMIRNSIERELKKSPKFADIPFYHMSTLTPPNVYMVVCPCIEVSNDIKQHYDSMTSKYTYGIYEVLSDE
jgi:hypothetical protein